MCEVGNIVEPASTSMANGPVLSVVYPTRMYHAWQTVSMLPFKLIYADDYLLPIGNHVFPADKYRRVHDQLLASGVAGRADFLTPEPASDPDILLVHTPQYVHKLKSGMLSAREEAEMEIPYSPQLVRAFWL